MNLRRIKHMVLRLSPEEKAAAIGAVMVLVSAFAPWYSININISGEQNISYSGFAGDIGVIGFMVFLLTLAGLIFLTGGHMGFKLPYFGYKKERIILFLSGQSAFLVLLSAAVYTRRTIDYTNAELRFGIYMALVGACLFAFSAFASAHRTGREETEAFFSHPGKESGGAERTENTKKIKDMRGTEKAPVHADDLPQTDKIRKPFAKSGKTEKTEPFSFSGGQENFFSGSVTDSKSAAEDAFAAATDIPSGHDETDKMNSEEEMELGVGERIEFAAEHPHQYERPDEKTQEGRAYARPGITEVTAAHMRAATEDKTEDTASSPISAPIAQQENTIKNQGDHLMRDAGILKTEKTPAVKVDMKNIKIIQKKTGLHAELFYEDV